MRLTIDLGDDAPQLDVPAERYVSYFINAMGEQLLFVACPGERTATLYHSDHGWDPIPVGASPDPNLRRLIDKTPPQHRRGMHPMVPNLTGFDGDEVAWLNACWRASQPLRGEANEPVTEEHAEALGRAFGRTLTAHGGTLPKGTIDFAAGVEFSYANLPQHMAAAFLRGVYEGVKL